VPNYYTPGVYIEEVNTGPRPIEAVATAVAAFVGFAPAGPVNRPTLVTSWTQFVEEFGRRDPKTGRKDPYIAEAFLAHSVYGYFLNGGSRCYVVRIVPPETLKGLKPGVLTVHTAAARRRRDDEPQLKISARERKPDPDEPETRAAEITISIERTPGTAPSDKLWTFRVSAGEQSETFTHVTLQPPPAPKGKPATSAQPDPNAPPPDPNAPPPDPNAQANPAAGPARNGRPVRTLDQLSKESKLVQVELLDPKLVAEEPALGVYYIEAPQPAVAELVRTTPQDIVGDPVERTGVVGLELADDVTMVCVPDLFSKLAYKDGAIDPERVKAVQLAMINHCELVGGRMAILDTPRDLKAQGAEEWRLDKAGYDSMFAALYYPWIVVDNPRAGVEGESSTITVPPCGHVAGIYARNDAERGVHKAPANEIVRGVLRPAREVTHGEQEGLNPIGVNCIRTFRGRGVRVWGARTLSRTDPAWRYINVRRLFNMVEKSIERDTQWVVFEPNDPDLWSRVRRDVGAFLSVLWRDGMLFGSTPQEAFYVKCDEELNPPESRDLGRLIIEVGLAPVKPAEFVIFRFSQYAGGGE
jgi:phage tail sheath protein FI